MASAAPPSRPTLSLKSTKPAKPAAPAQATRGNAAGAPRNKAPLANAPSAKGNTWRSDASQAAKAPAARPGAPASRPLRGTTKPKAQSAKHRPPEPQQRTAPQQPVAAASTSSSPDIRLNKRLADLQWCSRREADDWIAKGWVQVNGQTAAMGTKVSVSDLIEVAPAAREQQAQQATIVLNKPVGYVSGQAEDGHEPAIVLITDRNHWSQDHQAHRGAPRSWRGFAPAGRLDIDSTGLLLLTQDGRLARQVIGEDSQIDKEYLVRVSYLLPNGHWETENVQAHFPVEKLQLLRHGLSLDGAALKPADVDWQNPEQLHFVLREGKKRQIRRMCEAVGLHVTGLKRVRIGQLRLGNLPVGQWRYLDAKEKL